MTLSLRTLGVLAAALLLSGCAGVKVEQYADTTPALVLEEYFAGPLTAWGIVQARATPSCCTSASPSTTAR